MTGELVKFHEFCCHNWETNHEKQIESNLKKIRLVDFATLTLALDLQSPELKGFSVGTKLIELVEQP